MKLRLILTFVLRDISKNAIVLSLIILTLALGCLAILLTGSVLDGFQTMLSNSARGWLGDIVLLPPNDRKTISHAQDVSNMLLSRDDIVATSTRSYGNLSVQFEEKISFPYTVIGINPKEEQQVSTLPFQMIEGSFFDEAKSPDEIILGTSIADDLAQGSGDGIRVHKNDTVQVLFPNGTSQNFRVRGVLDAKTFYPNFSVFFQKDILDNFPETARNKSIIVKSTPKSNIHNIQQSLQQSFPSLTIHTWLDESSYIEDILDATSFITKSIIQILIVSISVIIAIIIYINIIQKRRQIGILKSMGVSNHFIFTAYLFEAIAYFLIAFFLGLLLFFGIYSYSIHHPISMPIGDFHTVISPFVILIYFLIILSATLLGSIIPTHIATRTNIIDVLRNTL